MRRFALALLFPLAACVSAPPPTPVAADAAAFPVERFFTGRTSGEGMMRVMFQEERPVRVRSFGRVEPDGTIRLVQRIEEGGKPARERSWMLRQVAPGEYRGTLTDASGPVRAEVRGGRLYISYSMKGGMEVDQVLTMLPGGRAARNVLMVHKFGVMPVAALDETIVKVD